MDEPTASVFWMRKRRIEIQRSIYEVKNMSPAEYRRPCIIGVNYLPYPSFLLPFSPTERVPHIAYKSQPTKPSIAARRVDLTPTFGENISILIEREQQNGIWGKLTTSTLPPRALLVLDAATAPPPPPVEVTVPASPVEAEVGGAVTVPPEANWSKHATELDCPQHESASATWTLVHNIQTASASGVL